MSQNSYLRNFFPALKLYGNFIHTDFELQNKKRLFYLVLHTVSDLECGSVFSEVCSPWQPLPALFPTKVTLKSNQNRSQMDFWGPDTCITSPTQLLCPKQTHL